jgi:hypothetical protein
MWEIVMKVLPGAFIAISALLISIFFIKTENIMCNSTDSTGHKPITGANIFLLSEKEIKDYKNNVKNERNANAAFKLYQHYQLAVYNEDEAFKWLKKAASLDHLNAQYNLSLYYLNKIKNHRIPYNPTLAKQLLKKASDTGHEKASLLLKKLDRENDVAP